MLLLQVVSSGSYLIGKCIGPVFENLAGLKGSRLAKRFLSHEPRLGLRHYSLQPLIRVDLNNLNFLSDSKTSLVIYSPLYKAFDKFSLFWILPQVPCFDRFSVDWPAL